MRQRADKPRWGVRRQAVRLAAVALFLVATLLPGATGSRPGLAREGDIPTCVLPPPDPALIERVRRAIAAQPVPATPFPDGVSGEAHSMPYPPPPGESLDEATSFELLLFLHQFAACASAGALDALFGVLTEAKWVREFGDSPGSLDYALDLAASPVATPVAIQTLRVELLETWRMPDGRVVAVVKWIVDPPDPAYPFDIDTLILVHQDGRWLVDDNWYGQGCRFVAPADCPYGPPDGTPVA